MQLKNLAALKLSPINSLPLSRLKNADEIYVDINEPPLNRIIKYLFEAENPYLFRVNQTRVKLNFSPDCPFYIEDVLAKFFSRAEP